MEVRIVCVFVIMFAVTAHAIDSFDAAGLRVVVRVLDDCINSEGFSPCLKKKALTFINRLSRMDKLPLTEGVVIIKAQDAIKEANTTDEQLENSLPRGTDSHEDALDNILLEKITSYLSSRTLQVTMPKFSELVEEGKFLTTYTINKKILHYAPLFL